MRLLLLVLLSAVLSRPCFAEDKPSVNSSDQSTFSGEIRAPIPVRGQVSLSPVDRYFQIFTLVLFLMVILLLFSIRSQLEALRQSQGDHTEESPASPVR